MRLKFLNWLCDRFGHYAMKFLGWFKCGGFWGAGVGAPQGLLNVSEGIMEIV